MDPLTKVRRFHQLARENLRLSEMAYSFEGRKHHRSVAEHYLLMAEAELRASIKRLRNNLPQATAARVSDEKPPPVAEQV